MFSPAIVLVNPDDVEQVHGEADQLVSSSCSSITFGKRLRFSPPLEAGFQQAVTSLLQLRFQSLMLFATVI